MNADYIQVIQSEGHECNSFLGHLRILERFYLFFCHIYTQRGSQTHNPGNESHAPLTEPGTCPEGTLSTMLHIPSEVFFFLILFHTLFLMHFLF